MHKFYYGKYHKTYKLTDEQFLLLVEINNLGFVIRPQIDMLYSLILGKKTSLGYRSLYKLINRNHFLDSIGIKNSGIGQSAYTVGTTGRAFLKHYHCFVRNPRSFKINGHNLQANETLIQALYSAAFKPLALGQNNTALAENGKETQALTVLRQGIILPKYQLIPANLRDAPAISTRLNEDILKQYSNTASKAENISEALLISGATKQKTAQKLTALNAENTKPTEDDYFNSFLADDGNAAETRFGRLPKTGGSDVMVNCNKLSSIFPYIFHNNTRICKSVTLTYHKVSSNLPESSNKITTISLKWPIVKECFHTFTRKLPLIFHNSTKLRNVLRVLQLRPKFPALNPTFAGMQIQKDSAPSSFFSSQQSAKNPALIYKPIGLLPFQVDYSLKDQIQQTYAAQQTAKSSFSIKNYDIRPFNTQFGLKRTVKSTVSGTPFEADTMITFKRDDQICRVFIELDNRTEGLATPVQKIANYIAYASHHTDEDILLAIVSTDGSLHSKQVNGFQYPDRHLGMMAEKVLLAKIGQDKTLQDGTIQEAPNMVHRYYNACPNLKVIFAGVSEAPQRIAEFILDANHNAEYYLSAVNLAKRLSKHTIWSVNFKPVASLRDALKNPSAFLDNGYHNPHYNIPKTFGYFNYSTGRNNYIQPVIAGDEYDLDTVDTVLQYIKNFKKDLAIPSGSIIPPMVTHQEKEKHMLSPCQSLPSSATGTKILQLDRSTTISHNWGSITILTYCLSYVTFFSNILNMFRTTS